MRHRASQRRATHEARRAALTLKAEKRMAAAAKAEKAKTRQGSKGHVKSTVKASKPQKRCGSARVGLEGSHHPPR